MASIRKRNGKYEVQVRRTGQPRLSRTFHDIKTARQWARETEIAADRNSLETVIDKKSLKITLGELVGRCRDTVTVHKWRAYVERIVLNAFMLHPICRKSLLALRTTDFAAYRDERLKRVKPTTLKRELGPIHNMFEIARDECHLLSCGNFLCLLRIDDLMPSQCMNANAPNMSLFCVLISQPLFSHSECAALF